MRRLLRWDTTMMVACKKHWYCTTTMGLLDPFVQDKSLVKFVAGHSFVAIVVGASVGRAVNDVVTSIVEDVCIPMLYQVLIPWLNERDASKLRSAFEKVKTRLDTVSLARAVIIFGVTIVVSFVLVDTFVRNVNVFFDA